MSSGLAMSIILYLFLSMLLSILSVEIKKKYKVPSFLSLIILGAIFRLLGSASFLLHSAASVIDGPVGEMIQLTMVPCIIFEAALETDWYTFKKEFGQTFPLSTSVVMLSAVLTAIVFQFVILQPWSWQENVMLGLILSTADHVAVMTTLKDIHVTEKLESLLRGETLLSETTVLVLYKVLNNSIVQGDSILNFVYFLRLCLGGFAIGVGSAVCMMFSLKRIINDYIQETNVTIVYAYLTFWLCNYSKIDFSGAFGVMTLGMFMSAYGKILISPGIEKDLHLIWKFFCNNIQMLVFIIAGTTIEKVEEMGGFGVQDFGLVLVMFIFVNLIRALAIALHYPVLRFFGFTLNWRDLLILTLAGIKGVITTTLSLIVFNDSNLDPLFKKNVLFYTVNIVALSVLINPILLRIIARKFKLNALTPAEESILLGVTTAIIHHTNHKIEKIMRKHDLRLVKINEVISLAGPKAVLHDFMGHTNIGKTMLNEALDESFDYHTGLFSGKHCGSRDEYFNEMKRRFYSVLKRSYWSLFVRGQCRGTTALILIESCNKAIDSQKDSINDWTVLEEKIYSHSRMEFYKKYKERPVAGKIFRALIYSGIIKAYDVAHTFVRGSYSAQKIMKQIDIDIEDNINLNIVEEVDYQIFKCQQFIKKYITDSYPEIISDVQTKMSTYSLLIKQKKLVKKIYTQGLVKDLEHRNLDSVLQTNFKELAFKPDPSIPTLFQMLKNRFSKSTKADISRILPFVTEKHYQPDTFLFAESESILGAYLIFSGQVLEYGKDINIDLTIGNIAGAYCLLDSFSEVYITSAITKTVVIAGFIPLGVIREACFLEELYRESVIHLMVYFKEKFGIANCGVEHIQRIAENSKAWYLQAGSPVNLRRGALVLMGKLRKNKEMFDLIRPCKKIVESLDDVVVLIFPPHFGGILRQTRLLGEAIGSYYIKYKSRKHKTGEEVLEGHFKFRELSLSDSDMSD